MARYVDFPLGQDGVVRVEVEPTGEPAEVVRGGSQRGVKDTIETAGLAFEQALGKLRPMCAAIIRQVRDAAEQPEEVTVEFGVKLSAEAGVILAKSAGEANLSISIKWKRRQGTGETA